MVVLDTGALGTLADPRRRHRLRALAEQVAAGRVDLIVPAIVLTETLTGRPHDAPANRLLKTVAIVDIDEQLARAGASLRYRARTGSAVDAVVAATAIGYERAVVLTSDPNDLSALLADRPTVVVEAV